jgi:hypothetical protein
MRLPYAPVIRASIAEYRSFQKIPAEKIPGDDML